eukprot:GDKH01018038.1.p1 GENE.GDKH01018038.1~~GDKH01018038.1.p1  ORF type:complete len:222 (-),score=21.53 GDKH01018038.1:167-832(-)
MDFSSGIVKPTVHQLLSQHVPQLFGQQTATQVQTRFSKIHEVLDKNDALMRQIKDAERLVCEKAEHVRMAIHSGCDELNNCLALQSRIIDSTKDYEYHVTSLSNMSAEISKQVERIFPADRSTSPSGSITLPSNFFIDLHRQLTEHVAFLDSRLGELEKAVAYLKREQSAVSSGPVQAAMLESIVKYQYTQYRQIAEIVNRLQTRLQSLQSLQESDMGRFR